MTVKIAIIGLGQIGGSIGLALANHKNQVSTIGFDSSSEVARKAEKMGAVESLGHNLSKTVKEADMVVLAVPLDQMQEMLKSIAFAARGGTVVIDTAPVKQAVAVWAQKHLANRCQYIGLTPAINALALDETGKGIEMARADLFQKSLVAVTAPQSTSEEAVQLVTSFVTLLGARPFFADPAEVDGIMATIHTLPTLAAVALTETVFEQPGWSDIRKLAGKPFAAAMRPLDLEDPEALVEAVQQNRTNTVRVLDDYIATLKNLREAIEAGEGDKLQVRLERDRDKREQWRRVRADGDWQSIEMVEQEIPTFSDLWMQQLGLGKLIGLGNKKPRKDQRE